MKRFIRVLVESFLRTFSSRLQRQNRQSRDNGYEAYDILAMTAVQTFADKVGTVIVDRLHGLSRGGLASKGVLQSGFEIP